MDKNRKALFFGLLGLLALAACAITAKPTMVVPTARVSTTRDEQNSTTPQATMALPLVGTTETKAGIPGTPRSAPTKSTIIDNPNQVTDGYLKLSIKEVDEVCYQPDDRIPLILTYENLTGKSLTIADYDLISSHVVGGGRGRLIPVLTTSQNLRLLSREDSMLITIVNTKTTLIQILPAKSKFDVSVEYHLPVLLMLTGQLDGQFQPTSSGRYYLKFVYTADGYEGSWKGTVSSNQIEVCVVN